MTSDLRQRVRDEVTSVNGGLKTSPTLTDRQISHQTPSTARALLVVPAGAMPTPGASLINAPVVHSVPVYDRTQWLWEYGGRTPAKGLNNTSGFIHAKGGWREHYDKQLGWVALKPAAHAPFYVLSAHPAFKTMPVLVGFGSPDASFVGWDNGVAYHPALNANATAASRRSPHFCKTSHADQEYDTTFFLAPKKFVYRTNFYARWCWNPTDHHAAWDKRLDHINVPPVQIGLFWQPFVNNPGRFFHGAPSFTANGYRNGGTYINAWYNMEESPTKLIGITLNSWTDELTIAGYYDGHWKRCSTNNSGLKRVGGSSDNAECAAIRGSIDGGWTPPHN